MDFQEFLNDWAIQAPQDFQEFLNLIGGMAIAYHVSFMISFHFQKLNWGALGPGLQTTHPLSFQPPSYHLLTVHTSLSPAGSNKAAALLEVHAHTDTITLNSNKGQL